MDFSEKDAARSKWKLSRKNNQRGRERGRGRGPPGSTRQAPTDLGSNVDRYSQEDDDDADGAPPEGPVRKSQGADLAEWLSQYSDHGPAFYARHRINLHKEIGLPPADSKSFEGLSFDVKGLAACLGALPLHTVLRVPPFSGEVEAQQVERRGFLETATLLSDNGTGEHKEDNTQPLRSAECTIDAERSVTTAPATQAAGLSTQIPQLRAGLVGNQSSKAQQEKKNEEPPREKVIDTSHDVDGDLDELLQLSKGLKIGGGGGGPLAAGRGDVVSSRAAPQDAAASDSFEDWLDTL